MSGRRRKPRPDAAERRHPLRNVARLRPTGPAVETPHAAPERERLTVKIPVELIEQLRNAVYYTPGLTITGFIEKCIIDNVGRMEKRRGAPFPKRAESLRAGRPRSKNR